MGLDLWAVLTGAVLLLWWDRSSLDLAVVRWFGTSRGFPWREAFLTSGVLHRGGRALGWGVALLWAADVARPLWAGPGRRERLRWLLAALAALAVVPLIKRASRTSCPWDLAEFGGTAQHVSHWALGLLDGGPGHCFPSGHATAAFAFLAGYFLLRDHRPRAARAWLVGVVAAGVLLGGGQVVRGAHYPSHVMWTAWICWSLFVTVDRLQRLASRPRVAHDSTALPRAGEAA